MRNSRAAGPAVRERLQAAAPTAGRKLLRCRSSWTLPRRTTPTPIRTPEVVRRMEPEAPVVPFPAADHRRTRRTSADPSCFDREFRDNGTRGSRSARGFDRFEMSPGLRTTWYGTSLKSYRGTGNEEPGDGMSDLDFGFEVHRRFVVDRVGGCMGSGGWVRVGKASYSQSQDADRLAKLSWHAGMEAGSQTQTRQPPRGRRQERQIHGQRGSSASAWIFLSLSAFPHQATHSQNRYHLMCTCINV